MATKKSKALAAAEKATGRTKAVASGAQPWSRAMVERAILAFHDVERVPPYDEDGIRALVKDFYRFVDVYDAGLIAPEGIALAAQFIRQAMVWLQQNPQHARVEGRTWDVTMVEKTIVWFNDTKRVPPHDKVGIKSLVEHFLRFEQILKVGLVEHGEAAYLAQAFVQVGHKWLQGEPTAKKHYESLASAAA
jgi:hypothetical protein